MASSYRRLKHEINLLDEDHEDFDIREKVIGRRISRRRFQVRRKLRLKIPNLKRLLRRKVKVVKVAWKKMYKRLKESQSHFGDLFAGNYLFMQVTPTPFKYVLSISIIMLRPTNMIMMFMPSLLLGIPSHLQGLLTNAF
ncbi:UNVERIFIED_CONTAM: hypothetical protein Scaly_3039800 [Sesamum calycinum]|uniref:Uncharacterized protein n=1 Tax=Sesamum calycinum TaxID=2727403 RepID=A0AAW2K6F3_9LAMI